MRGGIDSRSIYYIHPRVRLEIHPRTRLVIRALCSPLAVLRLLCMAGVGFLLFRLHVPH